MKLEISNHTYYVIQAAILDSISRMNKTEPKSEDLLQLIEVNDLLRRCEPASTASGSIEQPITESHTHD